MTISASNATLSLAAVVAESARKYPDKVAVIDGETRTTYRQLWERSLCIAAGLKDHGVRPGDRVALMMGNVADFPAAYYGILAAGAVVVPVHLLLTAREVAYVLRDSEASLILCYHPTANIAESAARDAGATAIETSTLGKPPRPCRTTNLARPRTPRSSFTRAERPAALRARYSHT